MYGLDPRKHICQCCLFFSWASHNQCGDPPDLSSWGAQRIWQHCRVVSTTIGMFTMHSTILSFFSLYFSSVREWSNPILLILRQSFIFLYDSPFMLGTIFPAFSPKFCGKKPSIFPGFLGKPSIFPWTFLLSPGERVFKLGDQEVVLMGGNYVIKGPPYFPPKEVVSADALEMSQGRMGREFSGDWFMRD